MGLPTDEPRGYLVVKAIEAVGLGQNGVRAWNEDVRDAFLRGARNARAHGSSRVHSKPRCNASLLPPVDRSTRARAAWGL